MCMYGCVCVLVFECVCMFLVYVWMRFSPCVCMYVCASECALIFVCGCECMRVNVFLVLVYVCMRVLVNVF